MLSSVALPSLGIFELDVRWFGRDGYDVPGVDEAGEEAKCYDLLVLVAIGCCERGLTAEQDVD